jgi:hypothetical protein
VRGLVRPLRPRKAPAQPAQDGLATLLVTVGPREAGSRWTTDRASSSPAMPRPPPTQPRPQPRQPGDEDPLCRAHCHPVDVPDPDIRPSPLQANRHSTTQGHFSTRPAHPATSNRDLRLMSPVQVCQRVSARSNGVVFVQVIGGKRANQYDPLPSATKEFVHIRCTVQSPHAVRRWADRDPRPCNRRADSRSAAHPHAVRRIRPVVWDRRQQSLVFVAGVAPAITIVRFAAAVNGY